MIRLRGHDVLARPEFISDVDEVERLLRKMMTLNPRGFGFRLIRWHLDRPGPQPTNRAGEGMDHEERERG